MSALDRLAEAAFPVERLAIVAYGLRVVESVPKRPRYASAAVDGAATGAIAGAVFGILFSLLSWIEPVVGALALAFFGLVLGGSVGALVGIVVHAVRRPGRSLASRTIVDADKYELAADAEVAVTAEILLELGPRARAAISDRVEETASELVSER